MESSSNEIAVIIGLIKASAVFIARVYYANSPLHSVRHCIAIYGGRKNKLNGLMRNKHSNREVIKTLLNHYALPVAT